MKNANQIITSLQNKPQFSKLSKYACIKKIQSLFIYGLEKMIKFAYIKNDILTFVLAHPGGKQEFDNNIEHIKSLLKLISPEECSQTRINDIKAFVIYEPLEPIKTIKMVSYIERATGNFDIQVHDEKLYALLEGIQTIIKEKKKT